MFVSRTSEVINITVHGEPLAYQLLNIIEFNSTRKRMTVRCGLIKNSHAKCVCVCVCVCVL